MSIDWAHFTYLSSLAGGVLLGLAAGLYVVLTGRVAGISGMVGAVLRGPLVARDQLLFLVGLVFSSGIWLLFKPLPATELHAGPALLIIAGVLVGVGTSLGNGCTSGHGVCGLSRLSVRSLIATLTFMATGFLSVFVLRHVL